MLKFCSYGPNDAGFDVSEIRKCQIRRSSDFQNSKSGIFKKCSNFVATGQTTPDLTFPGSGNVKSGVVGIFKIQKVLKFGTFKKHQNLAKNQGVTTQFFSNSRAPNLELQMRQKPITICHFCDPVGTPPGPAADDPKMPGKSQTVMG